MITINGPSVLINVFDELNRLCKENESLRKECDVLRAEVKRLGSMSSLETIEVTVGEKVVRFSIADSKISITNDSAEDVSFSCNIRVPENFTKEVLADGMAPV